MFVNLDFMVYFVNYVDYIHLNQHLVSEDAFNVHVKLMIHILI